eukprot:10470509-Prorocentrum_lima.AAC.1
MYDIFPTGHRRSRNRVPFGANNPGLFSARTMDRVFASGQWSFFMTNCPVTSGPASRCSNQSKQTALPYSAVYACDFFKAAPTPTTQ